MNFTNQKYLKYLPSKKFTLIASIAVVLAIAIFMIFFMSSKNENFSATKEKNGSALKIQNQTILDLIQNDSDGDKVADWEETLWGTDKNKKITFNDTPDATYIENRKKELKIEQNISIDEKKLTETDKFAREFFTSFTALKSSGQVDANTINSFSNSLGQNIVNPNLIDRYSEKDIKISSQNDTASKEGYYETMKNLFKNYQSTEGIGDELDIMSSGLVSYSADSTKISLEQYNKLNTIAAAYQNFAKEVIEIEVPSNLVQYHLQIANSSNNTGISVLNMGKVINDPVVGLSGLSQYQKYSDELIKAVTDLEAVLKQ